MSLYTVTELCSLLLLEFYIPHSSFLSKSDVIKHKQLAEKFDFEWYALKDEIFPLEFLSNQFLKEVSYLLNKPKTTEEEELYSIFKKIVALYMLMKKLANEIKSNEGMYFLQIILSEIGFLREDLELNSTLSQDIKLKKTIDEHLKNCLERISTIISIPSVIQDKSAEHFLSINIHDISLNEISLAVFNLITQVSPEFIQRLQIESYEKWLTLQNDIYEQAILEFHTHQIHVSNFETSIQIIEKAPFLGKKLQVIRQKCRLIYQLINLYIYLQYLLNQQMLNENEELFISLKNLITKILRTYKTDINKFFEIETHIVKKVLLKIDASIDYMTKNGIKVYEEKSLVDLEEIDLNDVTNAFHQLSFEYIEHIRVNNHSDAEIASTLCNKMFDYIIKNPISFSSYKIPLRYHNEIMNHFKQNIYEKIFFEEATIIQKEYPLLLELAAFYYYFFSISCDKSTIYETHVPVLLYLELNRIFKIINYSAIYHEASDYFKISLKKSFDYVRYLCEFSTTNSFIKRAYENGFTIIATFAQGTREYFEQEDGLCAGYVYQLAEYILVETQINSTKASRKQRWNIREKSPFEFSISSPFQQVCSNTRTYLFQEKPLIEVTDAIQMQYATSEFRFRTGADIAHKLLELLPDHPNSVLLLGMWEKGVKIGHAVACFVKDNMLHFFCATHSWIMIPYQEANPKFYSFLYQIFEELSFFSTYNHFFISVVYRTWEAKPVDDKHFHYERDAEQFPFVYSEHESEEYASIAYFNIRQTELQKENELERCLGLS